MKAELFNSFTFQRLCNHLCARCEQTRGPLSVPAARDDGAGSCARAGLLRAQQQELGTSAEGKHEPGDTELCNLS